MSFLTEATIRQLALGRQLARPTSTTPQTTHTSYFVVHGGRIMITQLYGLVTTLTPSGTNNAKWTSYPTTGTAGDMCAAADIASMEAGAQLGITGTVGDALVKITTAFAIKSMALPLIVPAGHLDFAADANKTGSIAWTLCYVPLDAGAYVAVA